MPPPGMDLDLLISLTFVGIAAYMMQRAMRQLDPRALKSERTSHGAQVAKRLLRGKDKMHLVLREHEIEVAADVVCSDDIDVSFAEIGGLSEQAKQLQQAIMLPVRRPSLFAQSKLFRSPKGILLHGPPGTGKTMLVRAIAREAKFTFFCVNLARLFSKWYGESNKFAEAYFSLARKLAPSLIFIDEVDCVFSKGRNSEHEATSVLKAQFLSLWDGLLSPSLAATPVVVIAATNRPDAVDPAVLRRLPLSFQIDLPGVQARAEVLRVLLRDEPLAAGVCVRSIAEATEGYSGSDLEQLCKTTAMGALEELLQAEAQREGEEAPPPPPPPPPDGALAAPPPKPTARAPPDVAPPPAPAPPPSSPLLQLRRLTLDDFLRARALVRPTRGRFDGVDHGLGTGHPSPPSDYDESLYD